MLSKSVRRKRHQNAEVYRRLSRLRLFFVDPRCDFWLVSAYGHAGTAIHAEVYGRENAKRTFAQRVNAIHAAYKAKT